MKRRQQKTVTVLHATKEQKKIDLNSTTFEALQEEAKNSKWNLRKVAKQAEVEFTVFLLFLKKKKWRLNPT